MKPDMFGLVHPTTLDILEGPQNPVSALTDPVYHSSSLHTGDVDRDVFVESAVWKHSIDYHDTRYSPHPYGAVIFNVSHQDGGVTPPGTGVQKAVTHQTSVEQILVAALSLAVVILLVDGITGTKWIQL